MGYFPSELPPLTSYVPASRRLIMFPCVCVLSFVSIMWFHVSCTLNVFARLFEHVEILLDFVWAHRLCPQSHHVQSSSCVGSRGLADQHTVTVGLFAACVFPVPGHTTPCVPLHVMC